MSRDVTAYPMWIGGKPAMGSSDELIDSVDPTTGKVIARFPQATRPTSTTLLQRRATPSRNGHGWTPGPAGGPWTL
jgi:hypothetical protein